MSAAAKSAPAPAVKKKAPLSSSATMLELIGCRISVALTDDTTITGKLLSFDHKQNVVLKDAERVRVTKSSNRQVREPAGLVYLRGSCLASISYKPSITTNHNVLDTRAELARRSLL